MPRNDTAGGSPPAGGDAAPRAADASPVGTPVAVSPNAAPFVRLTRLTYKTACFVCAATAAAEGRGRAAARDGPHADAVRAARRRPGGDRGSAPHRRDRA